MAPTPPPPHKTGTPLTRAAGLVIVPNTPKGRGVFASHRIPADGVVDTCPVLVLPLAELDQVTQTVLNHYTYNWPVKDPRTGRTARTQAVSLGLGSMFNHSTRGCNVVWSRQLEEEMIEYRAVRDIEVGEELCINYGRLWFPDADEGVEEQEQEQAEEVLGQIEVDL